jgi:hypothetical protein
MVRTLCEKFLSTFSDDGNFNETDGCLSNCTASKGYTCNGNPSVCIPGCGSGTINPPEQCDDGNQVKSSLYLSQKNPIDEVRAVTYYLLERHRWMSFQL